MLTAILHNYEFSKLLVQNSEINNLIIVILFLAICFFTLKGKGKHRIFLNRQQTDQLRGLAIILVVLGHLWVHVTNSLPKLLLGGDAVTLFLIISGYGLMHSYKNKIVVLSSFLTKRLKRVMIPYWTISVFIITLDYFFWNVPIL